MAGLRNLLVHDYFTIDYTRLKLHAKNLLKDSDLFQKEIMIWIKDNEN